MSKTKERVYSASGVTIPLVDGLSRRVTLVGILTEDSYPDITVDYKEVVAKGKRIETIVTEDIEIYSAEFAIGLSVVNPEDMAIATSEEGYLRARGRASKVSKRLTTLTTADKFFGDDTAHGVLQLQLQRIVQNPNKFIKVSPKKPKQVSTLDASWFDGVPAY